MAPKPIVVGVDGSPSSLRAAALGWQIAQATGASCRFVHVVPDLWTAATPDQMPLYSPELARLVEEDARAQLTAALAEAVPGAARSSLEIRVGRAPLALRDAAREYGAELVVLGGKHHGSLARGLGGSTAHYLVRTLDVPVLAAGPATRPVAQVLAAVDLSDVAPATLAVAQRIARLFGARLRVIHVVEPIKFPTVVPVVPDEEEYFSRSEAAFRRLVAPLAEIGAADRVVRRGIAAETIETEAAEWGADLIVVGSHGKGWVDRLLVGSTTERLLNLLPTSLLVVPAGARKGAVVAGGPRRRLPKRSRSVKGKARHESR